MLVQGIVFAGLTMVITARTGFTKLAPSTGSLPLLLADLPAWIRKCAVCLAIMNERGSDDLLTKLDTDFEVLADTTMRIITSGLTSHITLHEANVDLDGGSDALTMGLNLGEPQPTAAWTSNGGASESWDDMAHFLDILGTNDTQTYWDTFPQDMNLDDIMLPWETVSQ